MIDQTPRTKALFSALEDLISQQHPLYVLSEKIDWQKLEEAFAPCYAKTGRKGKPIRLMCGLLMLQRLRRLTDRGVVEQWSENAYFQYFCGMKNFTPAQPCSFTNIGFFRNRIGKEGQALLRAELLRVNENRKNLSKPRKSRSKRTKKQK